MQPLHPDDSRLTAYVLGELAPEDAAAIERAAAADTGLRTKIQEITDVQDFLTGRLAASADPRLPRQRENIRRNPQQTKSRRFASLQIWIIPAAAVVVLALATLILTRMPADKPLAAAGRHQELLEPAPVLPPAAVLPPAPAAWFLPENAAGSLPLDLPVTSERSSLTEISKSIREDGLLPPHHSVRLEEILNNFSVRLNGVTAIARDGALREAWDIAALPQVECLSFGIMDFVSSHYGAIPASAMRTPGQFSHPLVVRAKLEMVAACHAHGKVASHNVTTEIKDSAVVANDAQRAGAEFGFTRMWSIHPDQIKPIIKAFTPRLSEVNEATNILQEAMAANWGPIAQHGRLHDRASYRYYWTVLQRAKLAGLALPESAAAIVNQTEIH